MASQQNLLSPAELAYLHSSLSLPSPIRPDGRAPTQFRPLTAETGILPGTNGSARVCFSDGTEAIVGVKAEIEKTALAPAEEDGEARNETKGTDGDKIRVRGNWLELAIDIPGMRDDEASTVFLAEMLREALLADGELAKKLRINSRFHWRMYLDILLISPPLSYPLPLLSLTTHLALLATRIPRLKSEGDEDPMFDDDWEASQFIYPREGGAGSRPPVTLLVIAVGDNVIFDPAREELAVAETALAVSVSEVRARKDAGEMDVDSGGRELRLVALRTIDPPSRMTAPGVPNSVNVATNGASSQAKSRPDGQEQQAVEGVWKAPLGGIKFGVINSIIRTVLAKDGVAHEVLDGLEAIELA